MTSNTLVYWSILYNIAAVLSAILLMTLYRGGNAAFEDVVVFLLLCLVLLQFGQSIRDTR